jgi:hypothetical protein
LRRAEGALDGESADRAIMDVAEIGHCLRDRVSNFTPHYLDRVLAALRNQSLPYKQWELLLVA